MAATARSIDAPDSSRLSSDLDDSDSDTQSNSSNASSQDQAAGGFDVPASTPRVPPLGMKGFGGAAGREGRPPIPSLGLGLRLPPQTPRGPAARNIPVASLGKQDAPEVAAEDSQVRSLPKPPRLNLGVTSGDSEAGASPRVQPAKQSSRKVGTMTVDLLSHALALDSTSIKKAQKQGLTVLDAVRQRCSGSLGVATEELRFFEVRELAGDEQPSADCARVAVSINRSGFTLSALEELIADNKRLAAAADRSTSARDSMQQLVAEQNQALAKAQLKTSEQEAEVRRLQERCRGLDKEVDTLKHQLKRSDGLRIQGQRALDDLKQDFEALTKDIALDSVHSFSIPAIRDSFGASKEPPADSRIARVLERLTNENVLKQLENCLDKVTTKGVE